MSEKCREPNCPKRAQHGFDGYCISHGRLHGITKKSSPRCKEPNCPKQRVFGFDGYCVSHGRMHGITKKAP